MKQISENLVKSLKKKKLTLAIAESCTGGLLSSSITGIGGSSKVFKFGLVTYSNKSKNKILKVPNKIIKKYGAVSIQCCLSMVNNLSKIGKSNISISVTGIAGPGGGSKNKPVGLVYIGLKKGNKVKAQKYIIKNKGRSYIQNNIVRRSLKLIKELI
tara:strand:- start:288 stop:758 length:471 start_codon:yes stop_codon:yes gene_type:complete